MDETATSETRSGTPDGLGQVATSGTVDACIENVIRGANGYGR